MRRVVLFLSVLVACAAVGIAAELPKGVQDAHADYFQRAQESGSFECFDKSRTIPFNRVNDDYCDCPDGSDEPGTAACVYIHRERLAALPADWKFKCMNTGFKPQELPHSKVNDGFCDCCDGSDEYTGLVSCPNVCKQMEQDQAKRQAEEERMRAHALKVRNEMKTKAVEQRAELEQELPKLQEALKAAVVELEEAEAALSVLEEREREEKKKAQEKYDEWVKAEAETRNKAGVVKARCLKWRQTSGCSPEGEREPDKDRGCFSRILPDHSGYCECEIGDGDSDDDDEFSGEEIIMEGEELEQPPETVPPSPEKPMMRYNFTCEHVAFDCNYVCENGGAIGVTNPDDGAPPTGDKYVLPEAEEKRRSVRDLQGKVTSTNQTILNSMQTLARPLGTEDILRTLKGLSLTIDHQDYTYELRLFDEAFQHDKGKKNGPSLGKWKSFAETTYSLWSKDAYDLSQMIYDQGQSCWNGVIRSTEVHVVCGSENKLVDIEEPSMCRYKMVIETPAICDE